MAAYELCLHPSKVSFGSGLLSKGFRVTQLSSINVVKGKARLCETLKVRNNCTLEAVEDSKQAEAQCNSDT